MRTETIEKLIVKEEASFQDTVLKDVGDPVSDTDAVNLKTLNAAAFAGGWDNAVWDETTGNITFSIGGVDNKVVNIDNRYLTESQVESLISAGAQTTFEIVLQSGTSIADRLSKTVVKPSGWTLSTTGLDLVIEHDLSRYATNATVFATTTGVANQQLLNTAAHNGLLNASEDLLRIYSLATVQKEIRIFISFL